MTKRFQSEFSTEFLTGEFKQRFCRRLRPSQPTAVCARNAAPCAAERPFELEVHTSMRRKRFQHTDARAWEAIVFRRKRQQHRIVIAVAGGALQHQVVMIGVSGPAGVMENGESHGFKS